MFVFQVFLLGHGWMILTFASTRKHPDFSKNGKWKCFKYYTKSIKSLSMYYLLPFSHHSKHTP